MTHLLLVTLAAIAISLAPKPAERAPSQDGPDGFEDARALLEALERAGDGIRTLQADIQYDRRFKLQGDQHVRRGRLYYRSELPEVEGEGENERAFEIDFQTLRLVAEERLEEDRQVYIFDGRWLVERRPDKKQYIAREIAPPGAQFDPLRIGEGPLPIPIGQEADDVLARYDAELVPIASGFEDEPQREALTAFVDGCVQLRLTPRPERAESDDFRAIRLWYNAETLLPRMARTVNRRGDVSYVHLINVELNKALPDDAFQVDPPDEDDGWDVQIEPYRGG